MPTKKQRRKNKFQIAVENTPDVCTCYHAGLQALGRYAAKVILSTPTLCEGSIDIDTCTIQLYPNDNRWDYAIGYKSKVYFVEVHSAETSEVSVVLKKLKWLKRWLLEKAPEIRKLQANSPYYWIQSGKYNILPGSSQARQLASAGLRPIPSLHLE